MVDSTLLYFMVLGLLGGAAHIMVDAEKWEDLKEFSSFKKSVIGAVCGLIYFYLFSNFDFPNTVMAFVAGYAGTDFLNQIVSRYKKSKT